jgi:CheY-like chemotaxis protein/nitrogen-specific signal transduction histidine kinase
MSATDSFRAFADCLREPALLVSTAGDVMALNSAASTLLGAGHLAGTLTFRLADFLHGGGAALDDFIRACSRSRQPIFASFTLRSPAGEPQSFRTEGLLYEPATHNTPAMVFLRLIRREAANAPLVALDERLRAYARGHSGRPRYASVNEVVTAASALLRPLLGDEIELVTRLASDAPFVYLDPARLERVLVNVGIHGRDKMPQGGRLTIETSPADDAVTTIYVRDSGLVLSAADLDVLFEPVVGSSRSGLSLASARATLHELGGRIDVTSWRDTGTAFTIMLPVIPPPREGAVARPPETTILVVDDDDTARELIADSLHSAGFTVLSAGDGAAAIEIARARSTAIDLLVTDVVMPRMTGPKVAAALREKQPNMRVLYISGYTDKNDLPLDAPTAPSAFLAKPFTRGTLIGRVQALLDA